MDDFSNTTEKMDALGSFFGMSIKGQYIRDKLDHQTSLVKCKPSRSGTRDYESECKSANFVDVATFLLHFKVKTFF